MMMSRRSRLRLCVAIAAGISASAFEIKLARAQQNPNDPTVFLNASDAFGVSSFSGGPTYQWGASSDGSLPAGSPPVAGYAYVVTGSSAGTGILRTPVSGTASFAGNSLAILPFNAQANLYNSSTTITNPVDYSAALVIGGNTAGQTITVNNLVLGNGGAVIDSGSNASSAMSTTLTGAITLLPAGTTLDGVKTTVSGGIIDGTAEPSTGQANVNNLFVINANLYGSGLLHVVSSNGTSGSTVAINSSNPSFTGGILLDNTVPSSSGNQPYLLINSPTALGTGTFTIGSMNGSGGTSGSGPTIDNASGAAETLTTNNPLVFNGSFQYQGNNPQTTAPDSLNLGAGGVTLGNSIQIGVYGHGVLSEMGNVVAASSFGNTVPVTLTINYGGTFEVPSPASLQITQTNVSGQSTLAFLATNTSSAAYIAVLNNSAGFNFNFSSNTSIGIDTTGYTGTFVLSGTLPVTQIGVNKLGSGTAQLSLTNAFAGPTNVSAGTLQLGNAASLGTVPVSIQPGATLDLNGNSLNIAYLNGSGSVINNGAVGTALTIVTGSSSASATSAAIYSGNISNGTSPLGLTVNLTTGTYNFNASGAMGTYSGGTLLKSGTLIVGANTIPANSNVAFNGGSLDFAAQPAGSFTMNVGSGSNYNFNAAAGVTAFLSGGLANSSTASASVNMSGPGVVILGGVNTFGGNINIASGSTFGFTSPSAFSPAISRTNSIALPTANSSFGIGNSAGNNYTLTMGVSGLGGLNKVGTNTVTLTGTGYTYTGTTNVSGGTLILGQSGVLAGAGNVSIGAAGVLDLGGYNLTVPNLIGTGVVTNNASTPVALQIAKGTSTVGAGWAGNISNGTSTVALVVTPSNGIFNMSGSVNSYTGGTNLASGTLVVGAASLPASGTVLFNGGSLDFTAPLTIDPSGNFVSVNASPYNFNDSNGTVVTLSHGLADSASGPTGVTMNGSGTVILAGANTFTGPITINSGTLAFSSPGAFPGGLSGGGGLGVNGGFFGIGNNTSNFTLVNAISGAGGLNKIGTDTVTLTGANTYTGLTQVSQGTLAIGSSNGLGASMNVSVGSNSVPNGILDLNGYSITLNSLVGGGAGGGVTNSNSSPSVLTMSSTTAGSLFSGSLTGNLSLVVNYPNPTSSTTPALTLGPATTIANANTYTGTTNLASGVLAVNGPGLLPTSGHNIQFNGGFLQLSGNNQAVAGTIDPSAGFSLAPNQQYNIIAGSNAYIYTFNSSLNSVGGALTLGNYVYGSSGTLVLAAANAFSGPTTVNVGTLDVANPQALAGTSGITVNSFTAGALGSLPVNATLQISDTSGQAGLNFAGQPITSNVSGLGYYSGTVTKGLIYYVRVTTNIPVGYAYTGALQGTAPNGSAGTVAQPDVWAGNISIGNGFQLTFNGNTTNFIGISGGYNNNNSSGSAANPLGGGALKITGAITGTGNVVLGLNNYSDTILAGHNTYLGETQITSAWGGPTTVQLGANNVIPAASGLDFANNNAVQGAFGRGTSSPLYNFGSATFDLNGYSTSIAYITSTTSVINNLTSVTTLNTNGVVTNTKDGSVSTLTILSQASTAYQGVFQDGSGTAKLALDFNGGVQTITGNNNYSGGTTVDSGTLIINGLTSINPLGTGNLNVNSSGGMIIRNTSASALFAAAQSGYNNGKWNGNGIISTSAAADTTHLTAVGMLQPSSSTTFEGQTVNPTDTFLKLTYYGDANLDGQVDGSDYSLIDNGYLQGLTGWQNGDFNYDGVIDGSDYTLIDNAFNTQGAQFNSELVTPTAQVADGTASFSAVPEPSSLALLSLGTACLLGRKRRVSVRRHH